MKLFLGKQAPDDSYNAVGFRKSLENVCDDNECTEILAPQILDFIPKEKHGEFIHHLVSKLRRGGKLIIGGTDIISVALSTFNKQINTSDANQIIYGTSEEPNKVALSCLEDCRDIIRGVLKITKQIPGINFIIEGQRT